MELLTCVRRALEPGVVVVAERAADVAEVGAAAVVAAPAAGVDVAAGPPVAGVRAGKGRG